MSIPNSAMDKNERIAAINREMDDLHAQMNALQASMDKLKSERKSIETGFCIGDKVRDKRGRVAVVTDLREYFPKANLVRKDGVVGANFTIMYPGDNWQKV